MTISNSNIIQPINLGWLFFLNINFYVIIVMVINYGN
jgi:hypothetical protein